MKTLDVEFIGKGEVKGLHFKQVLKSEKAFIYEITDFKTQNKHWEVFERRISKENEATISGVVVKYQEREIYPNSKNFGSWAWCYSDYTRAYEKYISLNT